jgi:hypothetical protein
VSMAGNEEYVRREVCDIFRIEIKEDLKEIKDNIKILFGRLNWFYLIAISTLVSALSSVALIVITLKH